MSNDTETKRKMIESALDILKRRGYTDFKAEEIEEYEDPSSLKKQGDDFEFIPNIEVHTATGMSYAEVVPLRSADKMEMIHKWSLLSTLASMKNGDLMLMVPHGRMRYTNQLLKERTDIQAKVYKLGRISR